MGDQSQRRSLGKRFRNLFHRDSTPKPSQVASQGSITLSRDAQLLLRPFFGQVCEHYSVMVDNRFWTWEECEARSRNPCMYCRTLYQAIGGTCHCQLQGHNSQPDAERHKCVRFGRSYRPDDTLGVTWECGAGHIDIRFMYRESLHMASAADIYPFQLTQLHYHPGAQASHEWTEEVQTDPAAPEAIALYQDWLQQCFNHHPYCLEERRTATPRRILDVGDYNSGQIRLLETPRNLNGPYIAMSYCWGGAKPLMTTRDSLRQHEAGIPVDDLPQTYKDAVWLLRKLNVRYLWIDSLCISQDDHVEWQVEASRMGEIYSNADTVLIAACAEDVHAGFLRRRPGNQWREAHPPDGRWFPFDVHTRLSPHQTNPFRHSGGMYLDACNNVPVQRRAWCLQERLLAKRCLIFREDETVFECREGCECECANHSLGHRRRYEPVILATGRFPCQPFTGSRWHDDENFGMLAGGYLKYIWYPCLEEYTRRALSVHTDRLIAFRAIAALVQSAMPRDEYLAAIWPSHLIPGLCWSALHHETAQPSAYVAPSWSWASVNGPVLHSSMPNWPPETNAEGDARVIEAWTPRATGDSLGAVVDGAIVLDAYSCDVQLELQVDEITLVLGLERYKFRRKTRYGYFKFDMHIVSEPHPHEPGGQVLRRGSEPRRIAFGDGEATIAGKARLLRLCADFWLIVTPSRHDPSDFERIGIVETRCASHGEQQKNAQSGLDATATRSVVKIV